ncbi:MAG: PAS domain-containing protein [Acidimicrobiales bacterium]
MIRLGWKRFLGLGLALIALSTPFGLDGVGIAFFVVGLASVAAMVSGARHYKPRRAAIWYLFAAAVASFLLGGVAAELTLPADPLAAAPFPGWQEPFDLIGYLGSVAAVGLMARARQASRDRTITLDAAISMGGVGALAWAVFMSSYLHSEVLSPLGKATGICFTLVSLALGFVTVRVAIGPGSRPVAYRLLSIAVSGGFLSEAALELDLSGRVRLPGSELASTLIAALAVLFTAAAALHPTMAHLTEPPVDVTPRVTRRRLVAMTIAVLIPPVLLLAEPARRANVESAAIVGVWAVLSAMVMLRIWSLAKDREHVADLDQALAGAEASLVAAPDLSQMAIAVLDGAAALVGPLRWASLHSWGEDGWVSVARRGPGIPRPVATAPPIGPGDEWEWRHGDLVIDLHFSAGEVHAGVVTIGCTSRPDPLELGRVTRLVHDLSRALESAALREDLVRERSERRFRALVERSTDIVMVVDSDHVVRFVSPAGPRLLNRSEGDIVGRSYAELVVPDHLERFWALVERPGQELAELQLVTGDGVSRWFEISAADWHG